MTHELNPLFFLSLLNGENLKSEQNRMTLFLVDIHKVKSKFLIFFQYKKKMSEDTDNQRPGGLRDKHQFQR